jgi:hypothetical protein
MFCVIHHCTFQGTQLRLTTNTILTQTRWSEHPQNEFSQVQNDYQSNSLAAPTKACYLVGLKGNKMVNKMEKKGLQKSIMI